MLGGPQCPSRAWCELCYECCFFGDQGACGSPRECPKAMLLAPECEAGGVSAHDLRHKPSQKSE